VRPQKSTDGFELTFAVNHLAHYLLIRQMLPRLARDARVILTSSGTHDPEEKTGLPPPRHADAQLLAFPDRDPGKDGSEMKAGRHAYTSSKLCNVMTARELSRRLAADRPDVATAAFDPGFTPGTGLARDYPGPTGFIFRYLLPLFTRRGPRVSTPANSGRLLAELASLPAFASARGTYFAVHGTSAPAKPPSALARDDAACAKLWDDSARLVGITP
jgi:protochlorophyllide reductase